jgi:hypothetical protein
VPDFHPLANSVRLLLRHIGSSTGVIPQGLEINDVVFDRDDPIFQDTDADIFRGDRRGTAVAVKKLRYMNAKPIVRRRCLMSLEYADGLLIDIIIFTCRSFAARS